MSVDSHEDDERGEAQGTQPTRHHMTSFLNKIKRMRQVGVFLIMLSISYVVGRMHTSQRPHDTSQHENRDGSWPVPEARHNAETSHTSPRSWTCAMHPQVNSSVAGMCPLCGMDLIPSEPALDTEQPHQTQREATLTLSPRARQLAELQTTEVRLMPLEAPSARLWGVVKVNDELKSVASAWVSGRVERLLVNSVGEEVKRGQALAEIYSPELYNAHQTLLSAKKSKHLTSLLESTQRRLRLLGVSAYQLKKMSNAKKPWRRISIRSDVTGVVLRAQVQAGAYVKSGQGLFELAKLDRMWAQLRLAERDLATLKLGQRFRIKSDAIPEHSYEGRVTLIEPMIDTHGRLGTARLEIAQGAEGTPRLLPGMLIHAYALSGDAEPPLRLVIPESAPLFAGQRSVVYVAGRDQAGVEHYQARVVRLGPKSGGLYPVISGLNRGERVVSRGAFTLDSEAQIRGMLSLSQVARTDRLSLAQSVHADHVDAQSSLDLSTETRQRLNSVLEGYLHLQETLAADDLDRALKSSKVWLEQLRSLSKTDLSATLSPQQLRAWSAMISVLNHDLAPVTKSASLDDARVHFKHLTLTIRDFLAVFGNTTNTVLREAFCPMAFNNLGGTWFQRSAQVDNVYYGDLMRRCGSIRTQLRSGQRLIKAHLHE